MRIRKVKVTKEKKISMAYEVRNKKGGWDEFTFICADEPRSEFHTALEVLAEHVIDMCELPPAYLEKIKVRGVSFSFGGENDTMGATISAAMELQNSHPDLNINTPHKAVEMYNPETPEDDMQLLSGKCIEALSELITECEAYIKGDRAQGSLFPVEEQITEVDSTEIGIVN